MHAIAQSTVIVFVYEGITVLHPHAQSTVIAIVYEGINVLHPHTKSTVIAIVYEGITVLHPYLISPSIKFPCGAELEQVLCDFHSLCGLLLGSGAVDGIFIRIKKPTKFGPTYYCYKHFAAIIILGCVELWGMRYLHICKCR